MLEIGDRVMVLDESTIGKIVSLNISTALVIDEETGFEISYRFKELVKVEDEKELQKIKIVKNTKDIKQVKTLRNNLKNKIPTIDLHLEDEKLCSFGKHHLEVQLNILSRFIERMRKRNKKRFIIIHGVGEGILKTEVRQQLYRKGYIYFDAPYNEFGEGATEAIKEDV